MIPTLQRMLAPGAIALSLVISIAMAQVPLTLRGKIESVSGQKLTVKARDGTMTNVKLADDVQVFRLNQASLADIKRGSLVGTTSIEQMGFADMSPKVVEIYIFPDDPKREPNDTVRSVASKSNEILSYIEGSVVDNVDQTLTIKNPGGQKRMAMPTNVKVVMLVATAVADIKVGQYFLVPDANPTSLGTIASTIIVGSDRADFAM
ncbi:hypothetical protein CQ12_25805 [Bradyrhizobium jicamae]|uniref:DUF5666 domain-containing protein n=1 Tax=Bradyrhizobium jicamae TaxID=280332 RepID=A0A0R3KLK9_9BRAD|nr:hypothetical protein [Bradyrhizobium jicamae]KRQ94206.1 hypothetical protein CQ12_25805 [Bradyrhizobium jicamae]